MSAARSRSHTPPLPGILGPAPKRRPMRVAEAIQSEVAMLLLQKVKDPRLAAVRLTRVEVTDDLSRARIYYAVPEEKMAAGAAKGLASAKGFIRSTLARVLNLRAVPELVFTRDTAFAQQQKLEQLLQDIKAENDSSS